MSIIATATLVTLLAVAGQTDTTVKVLYGHQEGAVVAYNPKKQGRPSHSYLSAADGRNQKRRRLTLPPD